MCAAHDRSIGLKAGALEAGALKRTNRSAAGLLAAGPSGHLRISQETPPTRIPAPTILGCVTDSPRGMPSGISRSSPPGHTRAPDDQERSTRGPPCRSLAPWPDPTSCQGCESLGLTDVDSYRTGMSRFDRPLPCRGGSRWISPGQRACDSASQQSRNAWDDPGVSMLNTITTLDNDESGSPADLRPNTYVDFPARS